MKWLFSILALVAIATIWSVLFNGFLFDDSYIAFRYSENWASGKGLTWNPGEDPVEGFTSFAWVSIGALLHYLIAVRPHVSMIYVGAACWVVLLAVVLPKAAGRVVSDNRLTVLTVFILAANAYFGFHAVLGLETILHTLALTAVVWLAIRPGEGGALALASVFSFTVRPDAIAFIAPIWAILLVLGEKRRGFVMLLAMLAVYVVCKWIYFGYPLPNTYYVKHAELLRGLDYVQGYLATLVPLWLFLAYAAGRVGLAKLLGDRTFLLLLLPSLMLCMGYVNLPPTVGTAYRLLIPTLPALCLACLRAHTLARFRSPAACLLALLAVTVVADVRIGRMYGPMREYFGQLNGMHVEAGHRLKQVSSLRPPPLLATRDIGAVSYFSQLPVLDLIGLSDEVVAHQGLTPEYVSERNPDVIMLQSVSEVPSLSALLEQYSHVAEWPYRDNGYDFFVRRDSPHYSELVALLRPQKVS